VKDNFGLKIILIFTSVSSFLFCTPTGKMTFGPRACNYVHLILNDLMLKGSVQLTYLLPRISSIFKLKSLDIRITGFNVTIFPNLKKI
jgi:hypothetical protein